MLLLVLIVCSCMALLRPQSACVQSPVLSKTRFGVQTLQPASSPVRRQHLLIDGLKRWAARRGQVVMVSAIGPR